MRITAIKYERKFNLENYESETIAIDVALSEGDDPNTALQAAKGFCERNKSKANGTAMTNNNWRANG